MLDIIEIIIVCVTVDALSKLLYISKLLRNILKFDILRVCLDSKSTSGNLSIDEKSSCSWLIIWKVLTNNHSFKLVSIVIVNTLTLVQKSHCLHKCFLFTHWRKHYSYCLGLASQRRNKNILPHHFYLNFQCLVRPMLEQQFQVTVDATMHGFNETLIIIILFDNGHKII